jgi:hypothetical protein
MRGLVDDWKHVARRAWSVRLAVLSGLLSAGEFALPYLAPQAPSRRFAAVAAALALAAAVARVVAQPRMRHDSPSHAAE